VRRRCAVLLTGSAVLAAALTLASSVGAAAPAGGWIYSKYRWQQPTTVTPSTVATVPAAPFAVSSYRWVQPWDLQSGKVPNTGDWAQPPASVPIA
jgi:hypothetical protein